MRISASYHVGIDFRSLLLDDGEAFRRSGSSSKKSARSIGKPYRGLELLSCSLVFLLSMENSRVGY